MDITKWKSVLVPIEVYEEIKRLAKREGRTISGQLRIMWEHWRKTHSWEGIMFKSILRLFFPQCFSKEEVKEKTVKKRGRPPKKKATIKAKRPVGRPKKKKNA